MHVCAAKKYQCVKGDPSAECPLASFCNRQNSTFTTRGRTPIQYLESRACVCVCVCQLWSHCSLTSGCMFHMSGVCFLLLSLESFCFPSCVRQMKRSPLEHESPGKIFSMTHSHLGAGRGTTGRDAPLPKSGWETLTLSLSQPGVYA